MDPRNLFGESITSWNTDAFNQSVRGICSVLLSLKKKPVIRFENASPMAMQLAQEVQVQKTCLYIRDMDGAEPGIVFSNLLNRIEKYPTRRSII